MTLWIKHHNLGVDPSLPGHVRDDISRKWGSWNLDQRTPKLGGSWGFQWTSEQLRISAHPGCLSL